MQRLDQLTMDVEFSKYAKDINHTIHLWLEGVKEIVGEIKFQKQKTEDYLAQKIKDFLPFTVLQSSSLILNYQEQFRSEDIQIKQIPIDNHYHFQFPLLLNKDNYKFMMTPCSLGSCRTTEPHSLPIIEIRKSKKFDESLKGYTGPILYDNRVHAYRLDSETIFAGYKTLFELVEHCKK